jgi:2-isopropylmalate synthase
VANAVAGLCGETIEVTSFETAITKSGETAVFVGCRMGEQAARFGVAVHADAAQAIVGAVASAVNRMPWNERNVVEREAVAA